MWSRTTTEDEKKTLARLFSLRGIPWIIPIRTRREQTPQEKFIAGNHRLRELKTTFQGT
jgi:hypothetical protein